MDADGIPLLPLAVVGHKRAKPAATSVGPPAAPVRPITDQRPKPVLAPRRSKAAPAGVRLATLPLGLAGARAPRSGCGVGGC